MTSVACVIFTCNKNFDILNTCMPTMQIIIDAYDCFVATDSFSKQQIDTIQSRYQGAFQIVQAGENASWIKVANVITNILEQKGYDGFICILDDFYFSHIDETKLLALTNAVKADAVDYVRLVDEKPRLSKIFVNSTATSHPKIKSLFRVPADNPYKHSLSLSYWRVSYFESLMNMGLSIWDFETINPIGETILYYTPDTICKYQHIVEKGRMAPFAKKMFANANMLGDERGIESYIEYAIKWVRSNLVFFVFGYFFMNRRLRKSRGSSSG
ncbi:hypothetical protein [Candidatus Puniceispirillum sp.]|uniref:hypothetical protein n=1 Tax=Candidatus Puniceispirillum sp. TaxID=2026719 RepID=UPI003F6A4024